MCVQEYNDKIEEESNVILERYHSSFVGHHGIGATLRKLKDDGFSWTSLREDVVNFIQCCPWCQKERDTEQWEINRSNGVIEAYNLFEEISVDTMTSLPEDKDGYNSIIVVIDEFSRLVELIPTESSLRAFISFIGRYGFVKRMRIFSC